MGSSLTTDHTPSNEETEISESYDAYGVEESQENEEYDRVIAELESEFKEKTKAYLRQQFDCERMDCTRNLFIVEKKQKKVNDLKNYTIQEDIDFIMKLE